MIELFVDLTTTTHATGRSAGSTRVEWQFARHVAAQEAAAAAATIVRYVSWSSHENAFLELGPDALATLQDDCGRTPGAPRGTHIEGQWPAPAPGTRRVLLVTGAGWLSNNRVLHELRTLRTRLNAELHVVIHDVTHLMFPHWFPQAEAARIGANLLAMIGGADALMVYSAATAADIDTVSTRLRVAHAPVRRIALGADLPATPDTRTPIAAMPFAPLIGGRPFVLFVSTITFRKNHDLIYQVWRRLAAELGDALPVLLFVGRVASDQETLADRIRRDAAVARHVHILSDVTDDQLASLYTQCAFTVYPSLYEGWGLPVAESLQYGKVCVTSHAAALPEAAGGVTPLLDPLDFAAWCAEIRGLTQRPHAVAELEARIRADYRPITWAAGAELVRAAAARPLPIRELDRLPVSARSGGVQCRVAVLDGFTPDGPPGAWRATTDRCRLGLLFEGAMPAAVRVWMTIRPCGSAASSVDVSMSGHPGDVWPLAPDTAPAARALVARRQVLSARGLLDLEFRAASASPAGCADAPFVVSDLRIECLDDADVAALEEARKNCWNVGEIVQFGASAPRRGFLKSGWAEPAAWGVWSHGPEATLEFTPLPADHHALFLRATVRAFVWPKAPTLDVEVLARGQHVTTWRFDHRSDAPQAERTLTLPASTAAAGPLDLTFRIPDCRSPRQLGMSEDDRLLGIALIRAQWLASPPARQTPDWR